MLTKILRFCEGVGMGIIAAVGFGVILVSGLGGMRVFNSEVIELHDLAELYKIVFFVALAGGCITALFAGARVLFCGRAQ